MYDATVALHWIIYIPIEFLYLTTTGSIQIIKVYTTENITH